jgi:imidazole glycerol-phosphate synthase subunit HisF
VLRYRVIPLVLLDGYAVVKSIRFDIRRNLGNPIVVARIYNSRNVDELILLDIDASKQNRKIDLHTVTAVAQECFMPLTVGGGLRSIEDISLTLKAGADKVALNTMLFDGIHFFKEAVSVFGSQCIVASLDITKSEQGTFEIYSHCGRKAQITLDDCLDILAEAEVGEILLNSVDLDGVMIGYDLDLIAHVSSIIKRIPIVAAGGAGCPHDCAKAVKAGASAVAAASIFHFTSITPRICKEEMAKEGIPVRI